MKQNNEGLPGATVGGGAGGDTASQRGEHHRLPQEQSRPQSGEQLSK